MVCLNCLFWVFFFNHWCTIKILRGRVYSFTHSVFFPTKCQEVHCVQNKNCLSPTAQKVFLCVCVFFTLATLVRRLKERWGEKKSSCNFLQQKQQISISLQKSVTISLLICHFEMKHFNGTMRSPMKNKRRQRNFFSPWKTHNAAEIPPQKLVNQPGKQKGLHLCCHSTPGDGMLSRVKLIISIYLPLKSRLERS